MSSPSIKLYGIKTLLNNYLQQFDALHTRLKHSHPPMDITVDDCIYCQVYGNILTNGPVRADLIESSSRDQILEDVQ
jgi:hypothetical protein